MIYAGSDPTQEVHTKIYYLNIYIGPIAPSRTAHPTPKVKGDREKREEKEKRDKQRRHVLPDLRIPLRDPDLDSPELPEMPPVTSYSAADANRTRRLSRWTTEVPAVSANISKPSGQLKDSFVTSFPTLNCSDRVTRPQSCITSSKTEDAAAVGDDHDINHTEKGTEPFSGNSPPTKAKMQKPLCRRKKGTICSFSLFN